MTLAHIVAVAQNDVIGVRNELPWDIPEDMKFFRDKTKGRLIIMGRKTFESVGHPLPNRMSVVVTRQTGFIVPASNVVTAPDLKSAITYCKDHVEKYGDEVFIIGGGEIFKESMPLADRIYLTRIHKSFNGDSFYPKIDRMLFKLVESRNRPGPPPFTFEKYERI